MPAVSALIPQITPAAQLMRVNGLLGHDPVGDGAARAGRRWGDLRLVGVGHRGLAPGDRAGRSSSTSSPRRSGSGCSPTIPVPTLRAAADTATSGLADLVDGLRYVRDHGVVRWLLVVFAIVFLLTVAPSTLTPLMVVRSFPSGDQGDVVQPRGPGAVVQPRHGGGRAPGGRPRPPAATGSGSSPASSLVFGALSIALGLAPSVWVFFAVHAPGRSRGAVLLDAVDDAAAGDGRARAPGPGVRARRDRHGRRDAGRDGHPRAAGGRGADRGDPASRPGC